MRDIRELMEKLSDIKSKVPLLILGNSSMLFKSNYNSNIYNLQNVSECTPDSLVVIDLDVYYDKLLLLSVISLYSKAIFLKKEDTLDIDDILMFKYIIKDDTVSKCEMLTTQQALDKLKTLDEDLDMNKFYLENSPSLKYNRRKTSRATSQSKIVSLLGGIE